MDTAADEVRRLQLDLCELHGSAFIDAAPQDILGFASSTIGRTPLNGLRHPETPSTTGWYVWFGEEWSTSRDFFEPMHVFHIYEKYPEIRPLLGLAPGYRFLIAENHLDVWFDQQLLDLKESHDQD